MTTLDLVLAAIVVIGALAGAWFGAWKQISHFVAWLAGVAAVYFLAGPVAKELEKPLEAPYFLTYALSALTLFVIAYLLVRVAFAVPARLRRGDEGKVAAALSALNRIGGAFLGGAKWALYVWVFLSLAVLIPPVAKQLSASAFARLSRRHNIVEWAFHDRISALRQAIEARSKSKSGAKDPLLPRDPRLAAIAKDATLREAILKGDFEALARSPVVVDLLNDREAMAAIVASFGSLGGRIDQALAK